MKNERVIYTAVFNDYDQVKLPVYRDPGYDYVVFTDELTYKEQRLDNLKDIDIRVVEKIESDDVAFWKAKDIKVNAYKYLPEYTHSIYIDGSFTQIQSVERFWKDDFSFNICEHPRRNCAYEEAKVCVRQGLTDAGWATQQIERYRKEGFPEEFGLYMGGMIARKHNSISMDISDLWWNEVCLGSKRDQISLPYVLWRLGIDIGIHEYHGHIDQIFKISHHKVK